MLYLFPSEINRNSKIKRMRFRLGEMTQEEGVTRTKTSARKLMSSPQQSLLWKMQNLQLKQLLSLAFLQVCCSNQGTCNWKPASIVSSSSYSVILQNPTCSDGIKGLRYAWSEWPCEYKQCPIYNLQELPAPPFITFSHNNPAWILLWVSWEWKEESAGYFADEKKEVWHTQLQLTFLKAVNLSGWWLQRRILKWATQLVTCQKGHSREGGSDVGDSYSCYLPEVS